MSKSSPMQKRLRFSGVLIILGLLVEAVTLFWSHPVAFLVFLLTGGLLLFLGMATFLLALLSISGGADASLRSGSQ